MRKPRINNLTYDSKGTEVIRKGIKKQKKIKITINIDEDILLGLKQNASKTGVPYQSMVNKMLRAMLAGKNNEASRLEKLEQEIAIIKKKLTA